MQYFIYHKTGEFIVVQEEEYRKLLKTKEWFKTPLEAEKAKEEDVKALIEEENRVAQTEKNKGDDK